MSHEAEGSEVMANNADISVQNTRRTELLWLSSMNTQAQSY